MLFQGLIINILVQTYSKKEPSFTNIVFSNTGKRCILKYAVDTYREIFFADTYARTYVNSNVPCSGRIRTREKRAVCLRRNGFVSVSIHGKTRPTGFEAVEQGLNCLLLLLLGLSS